MKLAPESSRAATMVRSLFTAPVVVKKSAPRPKGEKMTKPDGDKVMDPVAFP